MQIPSAPAPQDILPRVASYSQRTFKLAASVSFLMSALAILSYPFLQPVIPLFYTLAQPDKQLAPKIWIFLFPIFAWLVTFLHFSLLKSMKNLEGSIEKIFCWTTVGIIAVSALLFARITLTTL